MSKFLRKYYAVEDKIKIAEFELTDVEIAAFHAYNPGEKLLDDPSYTMPVIFLPNSMYKRDAIDYGDDPVVVSL